MNDWGKSVLEQYELEVTAVRRGRGALLCDTADGVWLLTPCGASEKHLEAENRILLQLTEQGITGVDRYVRNRDGTYLSEDADHKRYVLKTWWNGTECNPEKQEDCLAAMKTLARTHQGLCHCTLQEGERETLFQGQSLQAHPEVVCVYSPKSTEGLSWSIRAGIECVLGREQKREQQQECRRLPDWQEGDHWLLFLTADQPLVEKETIQNLLLQADNAERLTSGKTRIIRARYAGKEGSPVLFHASLIPELQQLSGDEGGRSVIRAHREEMEFVDVADERQMTDVDTVEDLEKLEQRKEDL